MTRMRLACATLVLAIATATAAATPDVMLRTRLTIDGAAGASEQVAAWTDGRKVVDDGRHRVLYDYAAGTVTTCDQRDRSCRVTTIDEVRREVERVTDRMRRGLRRLPRERRVELGQGGFDPRPRFTLRPTGRRERIAGVDAYELVLDGGPVTGSIWVSPAISRPREDLAWAPFTERFGGLDVMGSKFASAMTRLRGWPVRTVLWTPAAATVRTEVVDVRTDAPDDDLFAVPGGYRSAP